MALKVGIIGMRGIGMTHADAHSKDDLSDFVAVCDIVKERADAAAEKYGVRAYYSLADMLRNEELDIVDVTTGGYENGSWHYEPAMEAMEAGKHVLVEKPLSNQVVPKPAEKAMEYMKAGRLGETVYCLHKMGFSGGDATYGANKNSRWWGLPYAHFKAFLSHPLSVMRHFCGDVTHVQAFVNRPGVRRTAGDVMLSTVSIHLRFANDCVGYLLSQRGDATYGLGGWWSIEVAGTRGTFCIENCIEKVTFWPAPGTEKTGDAANLATPGGASGGPEVMNTGITDFSQTFPRRIHAFLEDVTNGVPLESLRASGRDALAALEYTWAAMESYEQGGALVRPQPLPPLHGDPATMVD